MNVLIGKTNATINPLFSEFKSGISVHLGKGNGREKSPFHLLDVGLDEGSELFPCISTEWLSSYSPGSGRPLRARLTCFQQDQDSQSSAQLKAASDPEYDLPNDHLINHTFEIDGLYLLEYVSVLLRAVFKVITTSPEDKDGHMYTAKEFLRLKLRRRWPQRNTRVVWFLFVQSSLPRLSRSLCWPWLCDFVWKCDFVWPKYFPLSYFDNVLALGSRLPRTHSGRRTHWCPILNRTSQLSDYSLVFVWLPLVILYVWWPSNDVQEHDICHHLR